MNHAHEADQGPGLLSNAIAIIAFIVVIAIVIWGLLHLANISTSWFTNLWPRSTPTMQISAPGAVESGTAATISWKYSGSDAGTYAFLYQCREGVSVQDADGARVLCGTVHPLVNAASSTMTITPVLSRTASTTLPFSVIFMPSATGSKQISGTATIAITAPATPVANAQTPVSASPSTSETRASASHTNAAQAYHSPADLRVRILSVSGGDLATVQFDVANIGGSASGSYTFTAYLPTADGYTYFSPTQASLGAGDHIVNTLQFSGSQGGSVSIVLHPSKSDATGNNTDSASVDASASSYGQAGTYDSYDYGYAYPQITYQQPYTYPAQTYTYPTYSYPTYQYNYTDPATYYQPQLPDETGYGMYYGY